MAEAYTNHFQDNGQSFIIHGRLSFYNGTPMFRIWIVGTKRIIGILDADRSVTSMPKYILDILEEDINDRQIFANFTITPITKFRKGEMQIGRIESASNIIVTNRNLVILRRINQVVNRKDR
jgi:hypothetical protein